jgi:hypothetical protein
MFSMRLLESPHPLTVLFTIAKHSYLAFEDGSPIFLQVPLDRFLAIFFTFRWL